MDIFKLTDSEYIKKTIQLAQKGRGNVSPNPLVGAVIVKDGRIIGKGYHQKFGEAHAEINALHQAGDEAKDSTLYITLEPCCHYGKTPPCTDAIIKAKIKRVVIGMTDPNPIVNQKGVQILRDNGIEVITGVHENECKQLNRVFTKYITTGLPFVTLKIAQTIDGRIATKSGHSQWITSQKARTEGHRLRSEVDAVIIGSGTACADDPQLTVRHIRGRNPFRIVMDNDLQISLTSKLLTDAFVHKTIIATTSHDEQKMNQIQKSGAQIWLISSDNNGYVSITSLLKKLAKQGISSVLVEGGSKIYTSFLKEKMVDRIFIAIAPKILGEGIQSVGDLGKLFINQAIQIENMKFKKADSDIIIFGDLKYEAKILI